MPIVRQTFKASGVGTIAGSYVLDGKFQRAASARLLRDDGELIFEGRAGLLKAFQGRCEGSERPATSAVLYLRSSTILKEDDKIEAYTMVEVPR